jgi:NADP-dependent 3-hydroxy acid dehydrogenase YdfG
MRKCKDPVAVITGAASGTGRGPADYCPRQEMKPLIQWRMDEMMEERHPFLPPMPGPNN